MLQVLRSVDEVFLDCLLNPQGTGICKRPKEDGASGEAAEILSHLRQLKGIGVVFN